MPTHTRNTANQHRVTEAFVHPVQLQFVTARELFLKLYRPLDHDHLLPEKDVRVESAASAYDPGTHTIQVSLQAVLGDETEPAPEQLAALVARDALSVRLKVVLVGQFRVDDTLFPLEQLEEWSALGGPAVLYPYLREEVSALTARAGVRPLILPLLQAPVVRPVVSGA